MKKVALGLFIFFLSMFLCGSLLYAQMPPGARPELGQQQLKQQMRKAEVQKKIDKKRDEEELSVVADEGADESDQVVEGTSDIGDHELT